MSKLCGNLGCLFMTRYAPATYISIFEEEKEYYFCLLPVIWFVEKKKKKPSISCLNCVSPSRSVFRYFSRALGLIGSNWIISSSWHCKLNEETITFLISIFTHFFGGFYLLSPRIRREKVRTSERERKKSEDRSISNTFTLNFRY
jgi:hypothetical protein